MNTQCKQRLLKPQLLQGFKSIPILFIITLIWSNGKKR